MQGTPWSHRERSFYKRLPKSSAIKVIDFGSTAYERPDHNYIVSTRHYRAPEVILGGFGLFFNQGSFTNFRIVLLLDYWA